MRTAQALKTLSSETQRIASAVLAGQHAPLPLSSPCSPKMPFESAQESLRRLSGIASRRAA